MEKLQKSEDKTIYITDRSSPDKIRLMMNMSKKMFKKGVGILYRKGLVELEANCIVLKEIPEEENTEA